MLQSSAESPPLTHSPPLLLFGNFGKHDFMKKMEIQAKPASYVLKQIQTDGGVQLENPGGGRAIGLPS